MSQFRFRAVAAGGAVRRGVMDAADAGVVAARLRDEGAVPLAVRAAGGPRWLKTGRLGGRRQAALLSRLAVLAGAGVPLESALAMMRDGAGVAERAVLERLLGRLRGGASLSAAMAAEEGFPPSVTALVAAGEMGGALPVALERLASQLAAAEAARQGLASVLIYPAILLATAAATVALVFGTVLPALRPMLADARPPLPVRVAFAASDILGGCWWVGLLAAAAAAVWIWRMGGLARDRWVARVPVFGRLLLLGELGRFCRTLGSLLAGGVAAPEALTAAQAGVRNRAVAARMAAAARRVREGGSLAACLADTGLMPGEAMAMIRVGEATGAPGPMLERLAGLLEEDGRREGARLVAVAVPGLTIVLGLMVAGIVSSVMLAVLSLNDLAR